MKIDSGYFIKNEENKIYHNVNTEKGSSGSPIILLLRNFTIIGIHEGGFDKKCNIGIYIKNIIDYINKNEIDGQFEIKEQNLGQEIQILNSKNKIKLIYLKISFLEMIWKNILNYI